MLGYRIEDSGNCFINLDLKILPLGSSQFQMVEKVGRILRIEWGVDIYHILLKEVDNKKKISSEVYLCPWEAKETNKLPCSNPRALLRGTLAK